MNRFSLSIAAGALRHPPSSLRNQFEKKIFIYYHGRIITMESPISSRCPPRRFLNGLVSIEKRTGSRFDYSNNRNKSETHFFILKKKILFDIRVARGLRLKGPFLPGRIHTQFTFYQQIHFDSSRKEKFLEFNLL